MPSAEQVIEKYIQAIGGKAAILSLKSLSREGKYEFSIHSTKVSAEITDVWRAPNKNYTEIKSSNGVLMQEAFDGRIGWEKSPSGYVEMSGQQLENKRQSSTNFVFADMADFKIIYPTIRLKGFDTINDKEVVVVEATPSAGKPDLFYFDKQTGLLTRFDYFAEGASQKGMMIPAQTYFEEYIEINGVMLPFLIREIEADRTSVIRFTSYPVKFNISVDDAKFEPPKDKGKNYADTQKQFEQGRGLLNDAGNEVALKNYDKALALCDQAVAVNPDNPNVYNYRGIVYSLKGQIDKAISDYSIAIKISPYNSILYFNRGTEYYKKSDYDSAIIDFTKAIEISPTTRNSYSSRCAAFFRKGKYDQALIDCSKAIELDVTKASLYNDRAVVYEKMGRKDLADADRKKYRELGGH